MKVIERIIQAREKVDLEKLWAKIEAQGIKILTWEDETYPQRLKEIDQPPPVLYIRGEYLPDDLFAVAIVGTRRVTALWKADHGGDLRPFLPRMGSQ